MKLGGGSGGGRELAKGSCTTWGVAKRCDMDGAMGGGGDIGGCGVQYSRGGAEGWTLRLSSRSQRAACKLEVWSALLAMSERKMPTLRSWASLAIRRDRNLIRSTNPRDTANHRALFKNNNTSFTNFYLTRASTAYCRECTRQRYGYIWSLLKVDEDKDAMIFIIWLQMREWKITFMYLYMYGIMYNYLFS